MQPLPAWAVERPRSRQYVIGKRRCRQRLAQRLGAGVPLARAAASERRSGAELELLLADESFSALVEHYRRFAELPETEMLAELRRLALDLLHLALRAGDLRAAIFFLGEQRQGHDPATSLAQAAIRKVRRTAEATTAPAERRLPPRAPAEPPRREADFAYCAGTQPSPAHAAALAAREAEALPTRTTATRHRLATRLLAEAERLGTAAAHPLATRAEAFGREAYGRGGTALEAAAEWQERRESFAEARVADLERPASDHRPASDWMAALGGHHQEAAAGTAAPLARNAPLPGWVDRVPGADRVRLLAMPEPIRAETLRVWARFYGFDTS